MRIQAFLTAAAVNLKRLGASVSSPWRRLTLKLRFAAWIGSITNTTCLSFLNSPRVERDYQELKQEVGLGHFEGRGWRGFHQHATLCIAAYGFLISERETIPPCGPRSTTLFPQPAIPVDYRPRGSVLAA
jgi:hypothetical protein